MVHLTLCSGNNLNIKHLMLITTLVFSMGCRSQIKVHIRSELEPPFSNQGEQEDYWAQELFKQDYKTEFYPKFDGIINSNENKIIFGKIQYIEFLDLNSEHQLIFEKGLFYPDILGGVNLKIGNLEEMTFLSDNPKVRRFSFWLYRPNIANPLVYFFELTNNKANEKTDWKSFVEGARLTFVKNGWAII